MYFQNKRNKQRSPKNHLVWCNDLIRLMKYKIYPSPWIDVNVQFRFLPMGFLKNMIPLFRPESHANILGCAKCPLKRVIQSWGRGQMNLIHSMVLLGQQQRQLAWMCRVYCVRSHFRNCFAVFAQPLLDFCATFDCIAIFGGPSDLLSKGEA